MRGGVLLLLAAGLVLFGRSLKRAYDYLQFIPIGLKTGKLGLFSTQLFYSFQIQNPTKATATVNAIYGVIQAAGKPIGTFRISNPFTIPPGGSVNLNTDVTISNIDFTTAVLSAVKAGQSPKIDFAGELATGLGTFPFKYTAALAGDLSLKKV